MTVSIAFLQSPVCNHVSIMNVVRMIFRPMKVNTALGIEKWFIFCISSISTALNSTEFQGISSSTAFFQSSVSVLTTYLFFPCHFSSNRTSVVLWGFFNTYICCLLKWCSNIQIATFVWVHCCSGHQKISWNA